MIKLARLAWYWSGFFIGAIGLIAVLPRGEDVSFLGYTLTGEIRSAIYSLMVVSNLHRIQLLKAQGGVR